MYFTKEIKNNTSRKINVVEITTPSSLHSFIRFPHELYKNNPYWVPPLDLDVKQRLNKKTNPFLQYGKIKLFAALDDHGKICGRIAAVINPAHNQLYKDKTGFFGLFECFDNYDTANSLFIEVKKHLAANGLNSVAGPVNFTTNDECGILVENFDDSPMIMCNYSPPYYNDLLYNCGFNKEIDLLSYEGYTGHIYPEKYYDVYKRIAANPLISFRTYNKNNYREDTLIIKDLYNEAFKTVWGYVPFSNDEALVMAKTFIQFHDRELIWICYYREKPVGFILGLPDINMVLKNLKGSLFPFGILRFYLNKNKIRTLRVLTLGVLREYRHLGLEILLIDKIHSRMKRAGYTKGELSVVMENNLNMRKVLENLGFSMTKRYRLYKAPIP